MHTKHWTQDTAQCQLVEGQVPSVAERLGLRGMKLARKESSPGNWNEVQQIVEWGSTEPTAGTIAQTLGPVHRAAMIHTVATEHPAIGNTGYLSMEPPHVLRGAPGPMNSCFTFHLR